MHMVLALAAGWIGLWLATGMFSRQYLTDVYAYVVWGAVAGTCLHQTVRGDLYGLLRQPLVASSLASALALTTSIFTRIIVEIQRAIWPFGTYLYAAFLNEIWLWVIVGCVTGLVFQGISYIPHFKLNVRQPVPLR